MIIYRLLFLLKEKIKMHKEQLKNIYIKYNTNNNMSNEILNYKINKKDFSKIIEEIFRNINLLILKITNQKDIFLSKIYYENKIEEMNNILNEIQNLINNNALSIIKYNLFYYNKKIKPFLNDKFFNNKDNFNSIIINENNRYNQEVSENKIYNNNKKNNKIEIENDKKEDLEERNEENKDFEEYKNEKDDNNEIEKENNKENNNQIIKKEDKENDNNYNENNVSQGNIIEDNQNISNKDDNEETNEINNNENNVNKNNELENIKNEENENSENNNEELNENEKEKGESNENKNEDLNEKEEEEEEKNENNNEDLKEQEEDENIRNNNEEEENEENEENEVKEDNGGKEDKEEKEDEENIHANNNNFDNSTDEFKINEDFNKEKENTIKISQSKELKADKIQLNYISNDIINEKNNNLDKIYLEQKNKKEEEIQIKIVEYNRKGKIIKNSTQLLESNKILINEIKNYQNLEKDQTYLYIETLPLILADFLQENKNYAIIEIENEISKDLYMLFDKNLINVINEYEELKKSGNI